LASEFLGPGKHPKRRKVLTLSISGAKSGVKLRTWLVVGPFEHQLDFRPLTANHNKHFGTYIAGDKCVTKCCLGAINMSDVFDAKTFVQHLNRGDFDGHLDNELTKLSQEQLSQVAALVETPATTKSDDN
jgi:hypothetical protein